MKHKYLNTKRGPNYTLGDQTAGDPHKALTKKPVWFLVGNGGMDYGNYYWGVYRDYYRDPAAHSLLRTRQKTRYSLSTRILLITSPTKP